MRIKLTKKIQDKVDEIITILDSKKFKPFSIHDLDNKKHNTLHILPYHHLHPILNTSIHI